MYSERPCAPPTSWPQWPAMGARLLLATSEGIRWPIKSCGLLLGRASGCDLVLSDARASRLQAIVFADGSGAHLNLLGQGAVAVNGEAVMRDRELVAGDRLELPGLVLHVVVDPSETADDTTTWVVAGPGGRFGLVRSPFSVGSAADSDLRIPGGAPVAFRFLLAGQVYVEPVAAVAINGQLAPAGQLVVVSAGDLVECDAGEFELVSGDPAPISTLADLARRPTADAPEAVHLTFMARGGRLSVDWRGEQRTVYLAERRCDLVAALLQPPDGFRPGDDIPDEAILPRVWPGRAMTRVDLNVLIHRTRHDLVRAGLDGQRLLARAEGGAATRFLIGPDAPVSVV